MQRTATPEGLFSLEMSLNCFSMYSRFSDPCREHIHLMVLGPGRARGEGAEVTDRRGAEVQHWDGKVLGS